MTWPFAIPALDFTADNSYTLTLKTQFHFFTTLELTAGADLIPVLGWLHRNHTCVAELVEQNLQLESVPQSKPRTGKNAVDELGPSLRRSFQSADGFGKAAFCVLSHPRGSA